MKTQRNYFGPHFLSAGQTLRNKLTLSLCTITTVGIDDDGRWIHATDHKTGETMIYSEDYLNHCEQVSR